eukprot:Sdes_comp18579_c0_seq2m8696
MSMISTLCWVPRGVSKRIPDKVELSDDDLKRLLKEAKEELKEANLSRAAQAQQHGEEASPDELAEYNMDDYDEDDDCEEGTPLEVGGLKGLLYHGGKDDGGYITLPKDAEDEGEREDFEIRDTDCLVLCGHTEEEYCRLEVNVYEEHDDNHYVHHDILLESFPLSLAWLDYDVASPQEKGNFVAVSSMTNRIEIWDLDVVNGVEPVCVLGGKRKKASKTPTGHSDAVLSLSWNGTNRSLLASGSADCTVKLWDLSCGKCVTTLSHHTDKVQIVVWHPVEAAVLLTGSFDKSIVVVDIRYPDAISRWTLPGEVECAVWNPFCPQQALVSCDNGCVYAFDVLRSGSEPLFVIQAHDKPVTSLALSSLCPGCLLTASTDKSFKVWDISEGSPSFVCSKSLKVGPVYDIKFSPDSPFVVALGGGKGVLKVVDIYQFSQVRSRFGSRVEISAVSLEKAERYQAKEEAKMNGEVDEEREDAEDAEDDDEKEQ